MLYKLFGSLVFYHLAYINASEVYSSIFAGIYDENVIKEYLLFVGNLFDVQNIQK